MNELKLTSTFQSPGKLSEIRAHLGPVIMLYATLLDLENTTGVF